MNKIHIIFRIFRRFSRKRYWFFLILFFFLLWVFFIAPFLLKIPNNFSYQADIVSVDNFYDEKIADFRGEQYSNTKFSYEVVDKK